MRTPSCACINCGHLLTATSTPGPEEPTPGPGDLTVCLYCSHLMVFTDKMTVRRLTDAEMIEAAGDPALLEVMQFTQAFRDWKKDEQAKDK